MSNAVVKIVKTAELNIVDQRIRLIGETKRLHSTSLHSHRQQADHIAIDRPATRPTSTQNAASEKHGVDDEHEKLKEGDPLQEVVEELVVTSSDTATHPGTVMIHLEHTRSAMSTMMGAWRLVTSASVAIRVSRMQRFGGLG